MTLRWVTEPVQSEDIRDNSNVIRYYQSCLVEEQYRGIRAYLTYRCEVLPLWSKEFGAPRVMGRGLSPETLEAFGVGYCPRDTPPIEGITQKEEDEVYEPLRNRITIPTYDVWGRPVAVLGRYLPLSKSKLKFLSTPCHKANHVYNLHRAKKAIVNRGFAFVLEGQIDVMTMWQLGIKNVVCCQGTGISLRQTAMLRRYTDTILYIPDNDQGGENSLNSVRKTQDKIARKYGKDYILKLDVERLPKGYKDVNELYTRGEYSQYFQFLEGIGNAS